MKFITIFQFAALSASGVFVPAYSRPDWGVLYEGMPGEVDLDALVAKFDPGEGNFLDGLDYQAPGPGTYLHASYVSFKASRRQVLFILLLTSPSLCIGDVRSPCPFLNVLANHGLVNRSGKDINVFELAAMSVFYDVGGPVGSFGIGAFMGAANITIPDGTTRITEDGPRIDLDALWDRPGEERDASMVFVNPGMAIPSLDTGAFPVTDELIADPGPNSANGNPNTARRPLPNGNRERFLEMTQTVNEDLLESLLSRNPDSDYLMFEDFLEAGRERIIQSRLHDSFFRFSDFDVRTAMGQYWFPLILSDKMDIRDGVPKEFVRMLWVENRLPDNFMPRIYRDPEFVSFLPKITEDPMATGIEFLGSMRAMVEETLSADLAGLKEDTAAASEKAKHVGGIPSRKSRRLRGKNVNVM